MHLDTDCVSPLLIQLSFELAVVHCRRKVAFPIRVRMLLELQIHSPYPIPQLVSDAFFLTLPSKHWQRHLVLRHKTRHVSYQTKETRRTPHTCSAYTLSRCSRNARISGTKG